MLARITIGNDHFTSGDRRIISVDVTLSENARASTCRFDIYDPGLEIGGRYFLASYESGGIEVPSDLLAAPQPPAPPQSSGAVAGGGGAASGSTANGTLSPSMRAILDMIAYAEGADYNVMFGGGTFDGFADHPRQLVGGGGYTSDAAGRYQFLSTTWDTLGLPDFTPENQDKGCVMLIERRGVLAQAEAGDLPGFLDQASYEWASLPPSRYGQPQKTLEELQGVYDAALARYQGAATTPTPPPAPPPIVDEAKPDPVETIEEKPETKPETKSPKGTEIIIEFGNHPAQMIAWHFIHTGTRVSGRSPDTTQFEGKSIRWEMSRRNVNASWENITLRELAEIVADAFGRDLRMEGDGPTYAALDATGISLHELLLRECKAIGYRIGDEGNTLILEPYRPEFTGFVITRQLFISMPSSIDRATGDSYKSASPEPPNPSTPDEQAAETPLEVDPLTGEIKQVAPENSAGMGGLGSSVITGNASPPIHGVVLQPAQGENLATKVAGAVATEIMPGNPLPFYRGILPDSVTGLPSQQIGAIDLADGKAEAEAIADESRRVMSYETQIEIKTTPAGLTLVPGQIVAIAEDCFETRTARDAWAKEWRISQIRRSFKGGSIATTLEIYTPQAQKPPQPKATAGTASSTPGGAASNVTLKPGELIWPMRIEGNSSMCGSGGSQTEWGLDRGYPHDGIDFGGYGIQPDPDLVWASGQGRVIKSHYEDGYGNIVEIEHAGGYMTFYAHLASIDPAMVVGAEVQQGQKVGIRGDTGGPYEIHLHFGIHLNGESVNPRDHISQPGIPIITP